MSHATVYFADINDPDETGADDPVFCHVVLAADHDRVVQERDLLRVEVEWLREALEMALPQMESDLVEIEGEWGSCRSLEKLIAEDADSEAVKTIIRCRAALSGSEE